MKNIWIIIPLILVLFTGGCQLFGWLPGVGQSAGNLPNTLPTLPKITNWVITLSILAIAISTVAFFNGSKSALSGVAGGVVALVLGITIQRYAGAIAIVGFVGAFGFLIWTVWFKHTALKETVWALGDMNDRVRRIKNSEKFGRGDVLALEDAGNNLTKRTQSVVRKINGNGK